jgi:hypothetical protein
LYSAKREALDGEDRLAVDARQEPDARIDGLPREAAIGALGDDHRARATIALGATLLGAGQPALLAQVLEQRGLRRDALCVDRRAVEQEADRLGHRRPRRTPVD